MKKFPVLIYYCHQDRARNFFREIFFPKNWSFSESHISKNAHVLEALGISAMYYLRKNLKNAQNHHVSIKNAEFLYKIPQIEVDYTKMTTDITLIEKHPKK